MKITIFNRSIIYQRAIFNSYVTNYRKVMEEFWANHELMTRGLAEQPEGTGGSGLCLGFAALVPRVEPPGWVVGPPEIVCLKKREYLLTSSQFVIANLRLAMVTTLG